MKGWNPMRFAPILPAVIAAVLLLGGCAGSAAPADAADPADLVGVTWVLSEVGGVEPVEGAAVTLRFADDGTVSGSGGCNRFSGTYEADPGKLTIGESLGSTMMACADDVMAVEAAVLAALPKATGFQVEEDRLTLKDSEPLATFKAQSQDLSDTSWTITGYLTGDGIVSPLADAETVLTFAADGSISGTAGCNRLIGKYAATDGALKFDAIGSTQMACLEPEGLMDQETAVIAALESTATYLIEGESLQLFNAEGVVAVSLGVA